MHGIRYLWRNSGSESIAQRSPHKRVTVAAFETASALGVSQCLNDPPGANERDSTSCLIFRLGGIRLNIAEPVKGGAPVVGLTATGGLSNAQCFGGAHVDQVQSARPIFRSPVTALPLPNGTPKCLFDLAAEDANGLHRVVHVGSLGFLSVTPHIAFA